MNRKTLIGGLIVLLIIGGLLGGLAFIGQKAFHSVSNTPNTNSVGFVSDVAPAQTEPTVVDLKIKGNKQSRIYHLKGCPNYEDIAERNIVWFKTREEAEAQKFRMAKNC